MKATVSASNGLQPRILNLVVLIGSLWLTTTASAGPYVFTRIADDTMTGGPLTMSAPGLGGYGGGLALNNLGVVAFYSYNPNTAPYGNIYTGNGGPISLAVQGSSSAGLWQWMAINDSGTIAYAKSGNGTQGIYKTDGATVFEGTGVPGNELIYSTMFAMNNSGTVAFTTTGPNTESRVRTGSGGPLTTIATADAGQLGSALFSIDINNLGRVAFQRYDLGTLSVFTGDGGPLTFIGQGGGGGGQDGPSINDSGHVAFRASGNGVYVGDGGPPAFYASGNSPQINNAGTVAFFLGNGIHVGPDPNSYALIMPNDALDGSTVLATGFPVINDLGQIAFGAVLADGRTGIYLATPVPEASVLVLGLSAIVIGVFGFSARIARMTKRGSTNDSHVGYQESVLL